MVQYNPLSFCQVVPSPLSEEKGGSVVLGPRPYVGATLRRDFQISDARPPPLFSGALFSPNPPSPPPPSPSTVCVPMERVVMILCVPMERVVMILWA